MSSMDFFKNAKAMRLRSNHDKYLLTEEDEESITQDRNGSSKNAQWVVETVPRCDFVIWLKSCYGKYLTTTNQLFLLGVTDRKVLQTQPERLDSSVEWEPITEGSRVKLKTRYGNFLRANGGFTTSAPPLPHSSSLNSETYTKSFKFSRKESSDSNVSSLQMAQGGIIYSQVAEDDGLVEDEGTQRYSLVFKGSGVEGLTRKFEEERGLRELSFSWCFEVK